MKLKRDASRRAEQSTLSRKERNNRIGKHKQKITMSSIYGNGRAAAVLRSRFKKERNAYSSDVDSDVSSGSGSRNFLCVGCCYNSCFIYSCSCCAEMTHYMRTHTHTRTGTDNVAQIYPNKAKYRQRNRERERRKCVELQGLQHGSRVQCTVPPLPSLPLPHPLHRLSPFQFPLIILYVCIGFFVARGRVKGDDRQSREQTDRDITSIAFQALLPLPLPLP